MARKSSRLLFPDQPSRKPKLLKRRALYHPTSGLRVEQVLLKSRIMMPPLDTIQRTNGNGSQTSDDRFEVKERKPIFRDLTASARRQLESIKFRKVYSKGALIFVQGQPSKNVYLVTEGKVKLSTCSCVGKVMILQIAGPGDMFGLSAALSKTEYETSAEALETCHVECIDTPDFIRFLRSSPEAGLVVANQLSRNYQKAHRQICALGLSDSVFDRIARLLLNWSSGEPNGELDVPINNFFTHEEIACMIGSSRETVTRTLKAFKERDLITIRGREAVIHDRRKLMAAIGTHRGYLSHTDF